MCSLLTYYNIISLNCSEALLVNTTHEISLNIYSGVLLTDNVYRFGLSAYNKKGYKLAKTFTQHLYHHWRQLKSEKLVRLIMLL